MDVVICSCRRWCCKGVGQFSGKGICWNVRSFIIDNGGFNLNLVVTIFKLACYNCTSMINRGKNEIY